MTNGVAPYAPNDPLRKVYGDWTYTAVFPICLERVSGQTCQPAHVSKPSQSVAEDANQISQTAGQASQWSSILQSSNGTRDSQLTEVGSVPWGNDFRSRHESQLTIEVDVATARQQILGFGGAFTEASGWTFAQLPSAGKEKVLKLYFGDASSGQLTDASKSDSKHTNGGIGYSLGRVTMNSPDFALSHYSYSNTSGDMSLSTFQHDLPRDHEYVLPFLKAAIDRAAPTKLHLFSAPWSPPAW
eukprot:SAG31_NODE_1815_length_7210_cov_7.167628_4_plen_243_part_00